MPMLMPQLTVRFSAHFGANRQIRALQIHVETVLVRACALCCILHRM